MIGERSSVVGWSGGLMATKVRQVSRTEALERRIEAHRHEAERLRALHGDPAAALGALLRESVGLTALLDTYREYREDKFSWLDGERSSVSDGR